MGIFSSPLDARGYATHAVTRKIATKGLQEMLDLLKERRDCLTCKKPLRMYEIFKYDGWCGDCYAKEKVDGHRDGKLKTA